MKKKVYDIVDDSPKLKAKVDDYIAKVEDSFEALDDVLIEIDDIVDEDFLAEEGTLANKIRRQRRASAQTFKRVIQFEQQKQKLIENTRIKKHDD